MNRRSRTSLLKLLIFLAVLGGSQAPARSQEPVFAPVPEGFRIGMEIELTTPALANLTSYFDYDSYQAKNAQSLNKKLSPDFYNDYLQDNPLALSELPSELRQKLTKGLHFETTWISGASPLIGTDGKALAEKPKILVPEGAFPAKLPAPSFEASSLMLSSKKPAPPTGFQASESGKLEVPKVLAWQTLNNRWRALTAVEKASVVRWEHLSPLKKAELAIQYRDDPIQIKKNLPEPERSMFERLSWSRDQDALEFRHRENVVVSDPLAFYRDVVLLARRAGVLNKILRPDNSPMKTSSFHYHVSIAGKDITAVSKALNRLSFIRRVNQGILNDLQGSGRFLYDPDADTKGLVRTHGEDRVEFRAHLLPLEEELKFNVHVLSLPTDEGLKLVHNQISGLMSDYAFDKLLENRMDYLPDFASNLSPEQTLRHENKKTLLAALKRHAAKVSQGFWSDLPQLLKDPDADIQRAILNALVRTSGWPEEFWKLVPAILGGADASARRTLLSAIERQPIWPLEVWDKIPKLMNSTEPGVLESLLHALGHQKALPPGVWEQIPSIIGHQGHALRPLLYLVKNQENWPRSFQVRLSTLLPLQATATQVGLLGAASVQKNLGPEMWALLSRYTTHEDPAVQEQAWETISKQTSLPQGFWGHAPEYLRNQNTIIEMGKVLDSQAVWPSEFWRQVPELMKDADSQVREGILFAMRRQPNWPQPVLDALPALIHSGKRRIEWALEAALKNRTHLSELNCIRDFLARR